MARRVSAKTRSTLRQIRQVEGEFRKLRAKGGSLRRAERALLQRVAKLTRRGKAPHLTTVEHRPGGKDKVTQQPVSGPATLMTVARARGGSGLFCGCAPIKVLRQPNDDIDICILIDCSNDPEHAGFRCHYYCMTLVALPLVG